jgi:hypothetical protein
MPFAKTFFCGSILALVVFQPLSVRGNATPEMSPRVAVTFGQPRDAGRTVPHADALNFTEGFDATVRFSCDLERIGRGRFACLFMKGADFKDGYCVMVRQDGALLVYLRGVQPAYRIVPLRLESGKDYTVRLYETPGLMRVFLDGRETGSYATKGVRDMTSNTGALRIGGSGHYGFTGLLRQVDIRPLDPAAVPPPQYLPAKKQARAEIRWTRPICIEKDRYIGWPSVCRLANGEILAVFSGDRSGHVCPYGKLQMVRSKDEGETWSPPRTIANGFLDDRDAGIVQMPDGEIIITYFTSIAYLSDPAAHIDRHPEYLRHHEKIPPEIVKESLGYFRLSSKDNGVTWSKPMRMKDVSHAPHGPIAMPDGSLLMLGRSFRNGQQIHSGEGPLHQSIISAWRSTDRAHTWSCLCPAIADVNGENAQPKMLHEPHVVLCGDGRLVGLVRYHGPDGCMRQTESSDGGRTWTPLRSSGMVGFPPHLLKLEGNRLVCVYGRRNGEVGFGNFACVSDDGGRTWDVKNEVALAHSHCGDLGYPASCRLPDGDILTVYYQQPQPGVLPHLFATKWRVVK